MKKSSAQRGKSLLTMLPVLWASGAAWGQGISLPTLPDQTARWWQWAVSIPAAVNPLTPKAADSTGGRYCMVGQDGDLWLLGGVFQSTEQSYPLEVVRECRVPYGKSVLLPVVNAACDVASEVASGNSVPSDPVRKSRYLRDCAKALADLVDKNTVSAKFGPVDAKGKWTARPIDVKRVSTLLPFSLSYPPAHIFSSGCGGPMAYQCSPDPNPSQAHADGYWAQVLPLLPGRYKFQTFGDFPAFKFALRVTYTLTVVGPNDQ